MSSAVARTTERSLTSRYPSLRGWWNEAAKRPSIRTGLSARVRTICPRLAGPEDRLLRRHLFIGGRSAIRTCGLSLTFHMGRNVPHLVRRWPTLIETLLGTKGKSYPQGRLENGKMTDHNNCDVVELFYRGWSRMRPDPRQRAKRKRWQDARMEPRRID